MKTVGLITEYNPFHNGHLYHIQMAKKMTGADRVIVVMSGNFVQRGTPAILDKYSRTAMALRNGADLVLELPVYYATASAEFFAAGAIALLDKTQCVDAVCFGSEWGELHELKEIAKLLADEPCDYRSKLQAYIRSGLSYPAARMRALVAYKRESGILPKISTEIFTEILINPNNILSIEYLKAIHKRKSKMKPFVLKRITAHYHNEDLTENISSATAIRKVLKNTDSYNLLSGQVPEAVLSILAAEDAPFLDADDFSLLLKYKLLLEKNNLTDYVDISSDLADRINNLLPSFTSYSQFNSELKTKQITSTRIQRALIHVLLGIKKENMQTYIKNDYIHYFRVLGFCRNTADLLTQMKRMSNIPIITKLAASKKNLSSASLKMLDEDLLASQIYHAIVSSKYNSAPYNEYTKQIIIE